MQHCRSPGPGSNTATGREGDGQYGGDVLPTTEGPNIQLKAEGHLPAIVDYYRHDITASGASGIYAVAGDAETTTTGNDITRTHNDAIHASATK